MWGTSSQDRHERNSLEGMRGNGWHPVYWHSDVARASLPYRLPGWYLMYLGKAPSNSKDLSSS